MILLDYKIGQILTSKVDTAVELALSGEKKVIPKGNKVIIGPDKLAHHIHTGMMQPLGDATVSGYDCAGLAEYLYLHLRAHFPMDEMLEDYEVTKEQLMEEIEYALDDMGF